jgi:hypothetical protein
MSILIGLALLSLLTVAAFLRGAWPLAAAGWGLVVLGALLGGDGGPFLIVAGAVLVLLGGASLTRGAIFDGSPKAKLSERKPSMFKGENYKHEPDMDSVHFTHRFWGP